MGSAYREPVYDMVRSVHRSQRFGRWLARMGVGVLAANFVLFGALVEGWCRVRFAVEREYLVARHAVQVSEVDNDGHQEWTVRSTSESTVACEAISDSGHGATGLMCSRTVGGVGQPSFTTHDVPVSAGILTEVCQKGETITSNGSSYECTASYRTAYGAPIVAVGNAGNDVGMATLGSSVRLIGKDGGQ